MQYDFPKLRGGSKAVWNFSENSCVLVWPSVVGCDNIDKDEKGDRGSRVTQLTGRQDLTGLYFAALGCNGLHRAVMECTRLYQEALDSSGLH